MKRIFLFILLSPVLLKAQYGWSLLGIGAFMSATESVHYYKNKDMGKREEFAANYLEHPEYYNPRDYIGRESFNVLSGGIFAEFGRGSGARWQTEAEWMKKSINSKDVANDITGEMTGYQKRKYKYIQWNNYLKFYNPIGYLSAWYFMPGIRLEYLFSNGSGAYNKYDGNFAKIWFSGNVGAGYEFGITKKIFMFTEYHWIPEILSHRFDNVRVRNRTFELRVGLVYRPKRKSIDDCNAPKYKGPAY
jgi:hypothetical protein